MTVSVLGVVVVTFNSADVILDCLESLLSAKGVKLHLTIVDNASTDATITVLRDWAAGRVAYTPPSELPFTVHPCPKPVALYTPADALPTSGYRIVLLETGINGGFAAGVNAGLAHLATNPGIDRFWILNPDSVTPADTPRAFAEEPAAEFSLMGGRLIYLEGNDQIQLDGGTINSRTGVTGNLNQYALHPATPAPSPTQMHFITGASMVASRAFYEAVGPMMEDYFLYYEEVDWALRRGDLPLAYCAGGIVYHRAGTAIGSATLKRPASPFSLYFKHRARLLFMRRHFPRNLPFAYAYSLAKAAQLLLKGYPEEARTILAASFGRPPSVAVRERLSPEAARLAFGETTG